MNTADLWDLSCFLRTMESRAKEAGIDPELVEAFGQAAERTLRAAGEAEVKPFECSERVRQMLTEPE